MNASTSTTGAAAVSNGAMMRMTAFGTIAQVAMVIVGHYNAFTRENLFALLGMAISLLFGAAWAKAAARGKGDGAKGGAIVGGVCALLGIAISVILRDTEPMILGVGTAGSAVTGALGGLIGAVISGRPATRG